MPLDTQLGETVNQKRNVVPSGKFVVYLVVCFAGNSFDVDGWVIV